MLALAPNLAKADFIEGFEDITTLVGSGWTIANQSAPVGASSWFQGNALITSQAGPPTSYIAANFLSGGAGGATISNWLIAPTSTFNNGDTFSFYTRTILGSTFPDRLQVRLSTNGGSSNVGTLATDVGDFTNLLLDINASQAIAGYPESWTQFNLTLTGLGGPTSGRLAFRYFVTNGGPTGSNSNFIGIDTVAYTSIPEPSSALVLGATGLGACLFRRRKG